MTRISRTLVAISVVVLTLAQAAGNGGAQTPSALPTIDPASGVQIGVLASGTASWDVFGTISLRLERVTSADSVTPLVSNGPELWFAESSELTITSPAGSEVISQGESSIVDGSGGISVAFGEGNCPSALRLVVAPVFAMVAEGTTSGPSLPPASRQDCPASAMLVDSSELPAPAMPVELVIGRSSLDANAWLEPVAFEGPVGFSGESGTVRVLSSAGVSAQIDPGSWLTLAPRTSAGLIEPIGVPATMLLVAVLPTGPAASAALPSTGEPPDYVSEMFGYELSWNDFWSVTENTANDIGERLVLSNGISTLYIESFGNYGETARVCIEGVLNRTISDPVYSNIVALDGSPGTPAVTSDDQGASAEMSLHFDDGTSAGDYVLMIDCRVIVPGQSVLLITHFAPVDLYSSEATLVEEILDTIEFGSP